MRIRLRPPIPPAMYAGTVGSTPARDPRETSRQLEEWRCQDFTDMGGIIDRFVGKHLPIENLELPPILMRASEDHATQYKRAPRRTWPGATPVQEAKLREVYAEQDVDGVMALAQARALGQNMALLGVLPSREHAGRYSLTSWIRADVEWVDMGDAPAERDIRYARSVRIAHPWRQPDGAYLLVSLVFERGSAYYETPAGRVGVYDAAGTNPFAPLLPLVGVRLAAPTVAGEWLPAPADDLWAAQVISCCVPTDITRQIQVMSPGLQVLSGQNVASLAGKGGGKGAGPGITRGPENILLLPVRTTGDDAPAAFAFHSTPPETDAYLSALAAYQGQVAAYRYLDVEVMRGGVSADAQREQRADLYAYRLSQERLWRRAEGDLAWLLTTHHNSVDPLKLPTTAPTVAYRYARVPSNELQAAQSMWLRSAMGQLSLVAELETPGEDLTDDERRARVDEMMAEHLRLVERLKGYVPAGLDSIAAITGLGKPGAPAPPMEAQPEPDDDEADPEDVQP